MNYLFMKKDLILFPIFLLSLCLNAFSQDTKDNKGIAPEFSTFKGTLLVLENRDFKDNTLNRMTERRFEKKYEGQYEWITEDDLASNGYKDKNKFRFIVQLRNARTGTSGGGSSDQTRFVMTDRFTDTKYETRNYTNWTHLMNQYIDLLEKERKKD